MSRARLRFPLGGFRNTRFLVSSKTRRFQLRVTGFRSTIMEEIRDT